MITGIFAIAFVAVYLFLHGESTSAIHEIFYVLLAGFAAICIGIDVLLHKLDGVANTQTTVKSSGSSTAGEQTKHEMDMSDKSPSITDTGILGRRHLGDKPQPKSAKSDDPWGNKSVTEKQS